MDRTSLVILGEIVFFGILQLFIQKAQWDRFYRRFDAHISAIRRDVARMRAAVRDLRRDFG